MNREKYDLLRQLELTCSPSDLWALLTLDKSETRYELAVQRFLGKVEPQTASNGAWIAVYGTELARAALEEVRVFRAPGDKLATLVAVHDDQYIEEVEIKGAVRTAGFLVSATATLDIDGEQITVPVRMHTHRLYADWLGPNTDSSVVSPYHAFGCSIVAARKDLPFAMLVHIDEYGHYAHLVEARYEWMDKVEKAMLDEHKVKPQPMTPLIEDEVEAPDHLVEIAEEYTKAVSLRLTLNKKVDSLKKVLREAMGDHRYMRCGPYLLVREVRHRRGYVVQEGSYEVLKVVEA